MRLINLFTGCLIFVLSNIAVAAPDAAEILSKSDAARGGGLPGIEWQLHILAKDGSSIDEQSVIVKADADNSLVVFVAPKSISDQKLLMAGQNMWFIREGLRRPVPLSPRQRLIGEASNGDVAATNYAEDYNAELLEIDTFEGEESYKLKLEALSDSATYPRIDYWVSVSSGLGMKAEFFTVSGRVFKVAHFEYDNEIAYKGERVPFVSKMVIEDRIKSGQTTTLTYTDVKVAELPRRTFDLNFLTR